MNIIDDFYRLKNNKTLNKIITISVILFILIILSFIMLKYSVEGETDKNLPFILSKIIVISSAEGTNLEQIDTKWNISITQNNDIYISISKNENYKKNEIIKNVYIENIKTEKNAFIGEIQSYKPIGEKLFKNEEQFIITDKLKYTGGTETNISEYRIGNQGGTIVFRSSNLNIRKL